MFWCALIGVAEVSMDYTRLRCTERVAEVVDRESDNRESGELKEWKESGSTSSIPFSLLFKVHSTAAKHKHGEGGTYLHELLEDSELVLPTPNIQPQRSAKLRAHLQRVQALAEQKEYNRMVCNIDPMAKQMNLYQFGLEVQSVNRQICAMLNFLVTVVGAFTFGYFAGYFAGYSVPICVFLGLVLGIMVFMADLYFLLRTPQNAAITRK